MEADGRWQPSNDDTTMGPTSMGWADGAEAKGIGEGKPVL